RYSGATGAPLGAFVVNAIRIGPRWAPTSGRRERVSGGAGYGAPGPAPEGASSRAAGALTVRVTACSTEHPGKPSPAYGAVLWRLRVGFSPTRPQQAAGARMLPKPSVAWAIGSIRAPTEAAAPPDEPPEMRLVSQGLLVGPYSRGSQVRDNPSS